MAFDPVSIFIHAISAGPHISGRFKVREYEGSGGSNIAVEFYIKSSPSSIQAALWPTSGPGNSNKIRCSF
ncbi:uncharacterized protein H6S33_006642 [Morchella sextelata]|uniref:uncharacterized protein n=1 Tax=Morchella sextelata TaxID=1174677 RepID=UPI001D03E05D|nr:uncharacterized protein H6S33_006642 [Morchella sextelata]KAH0604265.1 hypothetical protein H6S33_006642 [Morchella sextelata]